MTGPGLMGHRHLVASVGTAVLILLGPVSPAAHAVDLPASAGITVFDLGGGVGPQMRHTFDPAVWTCGFSHDYGGVLATYATVTCSYNSQLGVTFSCPNMVLSTTTGGGILGNFAAAGGRVECNGSASGALDTGVIYGTDTRHRSGNLGQVTKIVCTAYAGEAVYLRGPYTVACGDPSLPAFPQYALPRL